MKGRRTLRSLGEGGWRLRRISQDTPQQAAGSFIGTRLSDCRRAAAAFRYIAEQGKSGADAAVVWADGDQFAFMGIEVPRDYTNFSFLHETGFEHRVSGCSVCDSDRRKIVLSRLAAGLYVDREAARAMC